MPSLHKLERERFYIAVCEMKQLWPTNDNSALFKTNEQGEYLDAEINTLAKGWCASFDNLDASSVIIGRYEFCKDMLNELLESDKLSSDTQTKIKKHFLYNDEKFHVFEYMSDSLAILFDTEELLKNAITEANRSPISEG